MNIFQSSQLAKLYQPETNSNGEDNGQVTIIGGSSLFHGAALFSLKVASRIVDMTFFATPEKSVGYVAEQMKSKLLSFVWVPWEDLEAYIAKSDAVLIGPGFMRFSSEKDGERSRTIECDEECQKTKKITHDLLMKFPNKKWVIDAGSLQTMEADWIPDNAIITPNKKEFEILFKTKIQRSNGKITDQNLKIIQQHARKFNCIIVLKGPITYCFSSREIVEIQGGNPGLTKGGTGDTQAGLTVALLAKNEPMLAACAAAQIVKDAADELHKKQGVYFNADDLASEIPVILSNNFRK